MGLAKGHTNNPAGRPKGTPNKVGAELRERVTAFVDQYWEQMEADFEQLEPKERIQFFEKILGYTLPKLQSIKQKITQENEPPTITIFQIPDNGRGFDPSRMTDEELRAIVAAEEQSERAE